MSIDSNLMEIKQYTGSGYAPLVDFETWRVALLNFCEDVQPEKITTLQRHDETDEVFILLHGQCLLIIGEGRDTVSRLYFEDLKPGKLYNVKRGVWHNHVLSEDASVFIVENRNTSDRNSPQVRVSDAQKVEIVQMAKSYHLHHKLAEGENG
jgi:ureidoglycolate hydrolase